MPVPSIESGRQYSFCGHEVYVYSVKEGHWKTMVEYDCSWRGRYSCCDKDISISGIIPIEDALEFFNPIKE